MKLRTPLPLLALAAGLILYTNTGIAQSVPSQLSLPFDSTGRIPSLVRLKALLQKQGGQMQPYAPDIGVITAMYPDGVQVMASSFHKPDGTQGILLSCASLKQDQAEARCKEVERQYLSQR